MNNRILTIAAACYHKYSQHFVDLERFYEIAKEDGRVAEREDCANVCEILGADYKGRFGEDDSLFLASSECADAIRARSTK